MLFRSTLFAADGVWCAPYRTATGPADIAAWLKQSVPATPKRMHYVMNSIVDLAGETATAKSNYLVMVEGPDGPVPSSGRAVSPSSRCSRVGS